MMSTSHLIAFAKPFLPYPDPPEWLKQIGATRAQLMTFEHYSVIGQLGGFLTPIFVLILTGCVTIKAIRRGKKAEIKMPVLGPIIVIVLLGFLLSGWIAVPRD